MPINPQDDALLNSAVASDPSVQDDMLQAKYGTPGQQLKAGLEAAGEGALGPIAPMIEKAVGVDEKDIRGRAQANPGTAFAGKAAGFLGSAALGAGMAPALGAVGKAGAAAAGLGELSQASTLTKIGASALTNAIEGAGFAASDELSKMVLNDPEQTAGSALVGVGLGGLMGGVVGAGIGSISPLWKAASETQTAKVLNAVTDHLSGVETAAKTPVMQAIDELGVKMAPEVKSALSENPVVQQYAKHLEQSDTTGAGQAFQKSLSQFKTDLATSAEDAIKPYGNRVEELSLAKAGKKIGSTMAEEAGARMEPLAKEFDKIKLQFADSKLPYEHTAQMAEELSALAQSEGWLVSPTSDIAKQFNRVLTEIPNLKSVKNISDYITALNDTRSANMLDPKLGYKLGQIKDIFRKYETSAIETEMGQLFPDLLPRFRTAQAGYREQSKIAEAINSRLHIKGANASNLPGRLAEMAATDSETLLNRLSGKGDADLLKVLDEHFPKTAEELKKHMVDVLIDKAQAKAGPGQTFNAGQLIKSVEAMEPELRKFALPDMVVNKVDAVSQVLSKLAEKPHNFSNTARTLDSLLGGIPGSAVGVVTGILSHNPITGVLASKLTQTLGKDAPDAAKLTLLKFLGSDVPVSGSGFKAAFDYIRGVVKGDSLINKATQAIFKGGEVIPEKIIPDAAKREALDKIIKVAEIDPEKAVNAAGEVGHYMPDQATGIGMNGARAMSYLASIKPRDSKQNPLDAPRPVNTSKQAEYNRALDIAEQPLIILKSVAEGSVTSRDVQALTGMYPGLMQQLQAKLTSAMIDHLAKGETVPYKARLGLSVLSQQPLDSTMTSQGILAAQPQPEQPGPQSQSGPKASPQKLNKVDTLAMTTNQASLARKSGVQT